MSPRRLARHAPYYAFSVFAVLTAVTVYYHEPWSDEANSWLLGRDASLWELWTHLMHYEGTPALWQTILHLLIRLGFPYGGLNWFSGAIGCAGAWIFFRKAPLPLAIRLATPFTFYLFYQYSVIARSYCLLPVLLFWCAGIYSRALEKLGLFTFLLCLIAAVSVHGMIVSGAIWASFHWRIVRHWGSLAHDGRKRIRAMGIVYAMAVGLLAWSAWPAPDVLFASERDYSVGHILRIALDTLENGFTGEWISSLAAILACLPLLWRGPGFLMFGLSGACLFLFNAIIYANVWHEGIPLLALLFAIWISSDSAPAPQPRRVVWPAMAALLAVIAVQGYWAVETTAFDWRNPYSGARRAALFIRKNGIENHKPYGFGFACVALQPYFLRNIFANFRDGQPQAYFDWSVAFRNFEGEDYLAIAKPEYVIVGYKDEEQQILMRNSLLKSGYRMMEHFEGNLFWHDDILEPDAIDIYRRKAIEMSR